jgi:hypothetical protein
MMLPRDHTLDWTFVVESCRVVVFAWQVLYVYLFSAPTVVDDVQFSSLGASSQLNYTTSSVRTTDNTGIGNMTINVDSLKAQLASLPENLTKTISN